MFIFLQCYLIRFHRPPFIRPLKVRMGRHGLFSQAVLTVINLQLLVVLCYLTSKPGILPLMLPSHTAGIKNESNIYHFLSSPFILLHTTMKLFFHSYNYQVVQLRLKNKQTKTKPTVLTSHPMHFPM